MNEKAGESINELAPCTAITAQAAFEKTAVTISQGHVAPVAESDSNKIDDNLSVLYSGTNTGRKTIIKARGTVLQDRAANSANLKGFKAVIDDKLKVTEKLEQRRIFASFAMNSSFWEDLTAMKGIPPMRINEN